MSQTILNWLNSQIDFPKKIISIEDEFANGYYFGKLFESNNLFDNIKQLKNNNKKEDSLKNYALLGNIFDKIGLHLTQSDINELLNKKRYKAELYLFKIKQKISLKNCQFDEIMEKIKQESVSNKKVNPELLLKTKRNQSAKPTFYSQRYINTNDQVNGNITSTNNNIKNINENKKLNFTNYKSRLKSAKLPNLNRPKTGDKKRRLLYNDNKKDNEQELAEEKQIQSVLNDIKIFANIHMNKQKKIFNVNNRNPWDQISYIYNTDSLFDKDNNNKEDKKKLTILDLIDLENKKDNTNINSTDNKIEKLKSTLHNHNQFNVDNKKSYINKKNFEQGLFHMGLNSNSLLPSIAKIKDKNIPSEIVMKSINDSLRENIQKIHNNSPKNKTLFIPSTSNKKNSQNIIDKPDYYKTSSNIKRPLSSATTYNYKTKRNNKFNTNDDSKQKTGTKKRPLTSKQTKNNIKQIEDLKENLEKKQKNYKKFLSKIMESDLIGEEDSSQLSNINSLKNKDKFSEAAFFKSLHKEKKDDRIKKTEQKKTENLINKKFMKEIVSTIIDMTEVYYDCQQIKGEELIDVKKWNETLEKFIYNKQIIKRKKKKKVLTEEEIGNHDFDVYTPINEEYSKNYGIYEINEMKNYLNQVGNKYDKNKNNLFFKKINLKEENIEINDVMGEEIEILFEKAKAEGRQVIDEDDEEEFKKTGKFRYHPNKQELEILEPCTDNVPEYSFTNLISEVIEFGYNKDPASIISSPEKIKKGVSGVIEEPKKENSSDTKNNEEEKVNNKEDNEENNNNINNSNELMNINGNENSISFKEIINSIPIKISFVGILNNEIKITIKNSVNKYPKMKIYNPIELLNDLRQKKKRIDEPIDEVNLRKFQIDQLKKEKNNLTEEIKEYIELVENKNNLSDDEIYIKILQKKIKEDFEIKNIENIKQEIINKRETVNNLNNELNKVREEQQKKQRTNLRELQVFQQQLDKIDLDTMIGFVIINFPNTLEQSKLMEKQMIDFIQPCEQNKSIYEDINDKLLFLCDKEQKDYKFIKFNSFLEKIVYFYCDNSKLISENTVPQPIPVQNTNMAPPIQNGPGEFTTTQIEEYNNKFKDMEEFYQNFNLQIDKYDYYDGIVEEPNNQNNFNNNINMNSNNFMVRDRVIIEKMKNAQNIYEEKIVPKVNNSLLIEESCEEPLDDANPLKEKDSSRKISGDSSLKQAISNNNSKQQIKPQMKESNNSSLKNNNEKDNANNNDKIPSQKQVLSTFKPRILLSISQLSDEEKMNLYQIWYNFNKQFNYYCKRLFYRERTIKRKMAEDELDDLQKKFINFLSSPKEQKIIINQFIQKYKAFKDNYCKSNKINKSSNITVIKNFQNDLTELNETLWNIAKIRKNQGFEEIDRLEKENHIERELNLCYFKMERLIILETQKLIVIINIFIRYYNLTFSPKLISTNSQPQFTLDILLSNEILKNVDTEEFAKQKDKKIIYPRANRIYKNCFKVLIKMFIFLENYYTLMGTKDKKSNMMSSNYKSMKLKKPKSKNISSKKNSFNSVAQYNPNMKYDLQNQIKSSIKTYIGKYKYNIYNIYLNTLENLSKIYCPFKQVIKIMDSWIILSMELQSKNINDTLKKLDLTRGYKRNESNDKKLNEEIEKNIVDLIIKDDNDIFNFEYKGINPDDFILFDINKYLGVTNMNEGKNAKDNDCLKVYDFFKEADVLTKLRNNEIQKGIITISKFEEIFFKYFLFDNIDKFPKSFKNIDYHNISNFLSYFTYSSYEFNKSNKINEKNKGQPRELIYTNDVITILLLSGIQFKVIKDNYKNNEIYINQDKFMEINFGFENEIKKIISDKYKDFKLYLFNIHQNSNEIPEINVKQFINLISLKSTKKEVKSEIKKYFDLFYI